MSGYVYFIRCQDRVKIGFSKDPHRRLTKINADAPYPCDLIGAADASVYAEKGIHEQFAAARIHGEWFSLTPEILQFAKSANALDPASFGNKFERANIAEFPPLKAWRYRNRMTQQDAAAALEVTAGFLSRVESGDYRFSADRVAEVSRVTGIPPQELRPDLADIFGAAPARKEQEGAS